MSDDDTQAYEAAGSERPTPDGETVTRPDMTAETAKLPTLERATTELPKAEPPTTEAPKAGRLTPEAPKAGQPTTELPITDPASAERPRLDQPRTPPSAPFDPAASTGHIRVTSTMTPVPPAAEARPPLRVGTVVWGLMVAAVGVGVLSLAWGAHLDTQLALIVLLGVAGVALLVGSLVGMRRSRTRMEGRG